MNSLPVVQAEAPFWFSQTLPIKVVLQGSPRSSDIHDLSEWRHLYYLGRDLEYVLLLPISLTVLTSTPKKYPWDLWRTTLNTDKRHGMKVHHPVFTDARLGNGILCYCRMKVFWSNVPKTLRNKSVENSIKGNIYEMEMAGSIWIEPSENHFHYRKYQ